MRYFLLSALCAFLISGCGASEPVALKDATPPAGYNPLFITGTAPFSKKMNDKPALFMSRVEANGPSKIKLYTQLVDSSGNYLSGAPKSKSMWCRLVDVCNGKSNEIKDFKLKEVTEDMKTPVAIALVMDHSGSMGESRAHAVQDAAEKFISLLRPEDALALIKYDTKVVVESPLETDQGTLRKRLQKTGLDGYGGYTAIADGIAAGINLLSEAKGYDRHAIIVFTDGRDNSSKIMRDSIIKLAKQTNTLVCAVDFGENIDKDYMNAIADGTGGTHHQVYRTAEFDLVFGDVYKKLKNYYLLEYTPRAFGEHVVSLKLCLPHDTAYAERTFDNAPKIGEISLLDINFNLNKADLTTESMASIENAEYILKAYPAMTVELRGHTDNSNSTSDPDYNKKLSQKRADAVKAELVKRGIASARIKALGFGESIPIADNTSEEGRARNRRTEFVTISK
jgi:outer membrane protein OmpA-like peptidoglycan-associated protein/Mg-chelatase subunit ChlD